MYSKLVGGWKSIKNNLIVLAPAICAGILEFFRVLPEHISVKYALPIGFITYYIKNWLQNKD